MPAELTQTINYTGLQQYIGEVQALLAPHRQKKKDPQKFANKIAAVVQKAYHLTRIGNEQPFMPAFAAEWISLFHNDGNLAKKFIYNPRSVFFPDKLKENFGNVPASKKTRASVGGASEVSKSGSKETEVRETRDSSSSKAAGSSSGRVAAPPAGPSSVLSSGSLSAPLAGSSSGRVASPLAAPPAGSSAPSRPSSASSSAPPSALQSGSSSERVAFPLAAPPAGLLAPPEMPLGPLSSGSSSASPSRPVAAPLLAAPMHSVLKIPYTVPQLKMSSVQRLALGPLTSTTQFTASRVQPQSVSRVAQFSTKLRSAPQKNTQVVSEKGWESYIKNYPLKNEIVITISGPDFTTQSSTDGSTKTETNQKKVADLRAQEREELAAKIPNIEEYEVDGKIRKSVIIDRKDYQTYVDIYKKYDELISPLLENEPKKETVSPYDKIGDYYISIPIERDGVESIIVENKKGKGALYEIITDKL